MSFRYDMRDKTPQQRAIVAKRDAEDARRKAESQAGKKEIDPPKKKLPLAVDKDTCPYYDSIISKDQCKACEYCINTRIIDGQPCVFCEKSLHV